MKKISLLFACMAFAFGLSAQVHHVSSAVEVPGTLPTLVSEGTDTLRPASLLDTACSKHLTYYTVAGHGFLTGNNDNGILENAQRYSCSGLVHVTNCLAYIYPKTPTHTTATTIKVYNVDATSLAPTGAAVGTSNPKAINTTSTTALTVYTFTTPVPVTDKFYVSFVLPTGLYDTVFVVSTNASKCNSPDSLSFQLWGSIWYSITSAWTYGTPPVHLSIDLVMFPVIQTSAGIETDEFINGIKLGQNQPNPSSSNTRIQYELQNGNMVSLEIYDISGKLVMTVDEGYQTAGRHDLIIDANKLQAGTYFYSLMSGNQRITKKMIIE